MSRGGIKELSYSKTTQAPFFINNTKSKYIICDIEQNEIKFQDKKEITFKNAFLKHFKWKSTEEFCLKLGIRKYFKSYNWGKQDYKFIKDKYFTFNEKSEEKRNLLNKYLEF